ncbi:MAG: hypothetical protein ACRDRK_17015 [Pseudonocardia sp.]
MTRHRSPSGRCTHQRPPTRAVALPGASPRHLNAQSALRNGMTAAAVTGGALAMVLPTLAITGSGAGTTADATELRLATAERSLAETAGATRTPLRATPSASPIAADGAVLLASVVPVAHDDEPEPPEITAAELLKAVGLADIAHKAEQERAAKADCDTGLGGLGPVKSWVRTAAHFLSCLYGEPTLIGRASRSSSYSDHPSGLAVDFMMSGARGDRLAGCALRNREALGIHYVIWKQRVNYGDGWERMEDRGSSTANHFDHVHISFLPRASGDTPTVGACA